MLNYRLSNVLSQHLRNVISIREASCFDVKDAPTFHVVSFVKVTSLGQLAATSGGSAVLLKLENPIFGKVELEPWDVSKLKPK